jgi:hypothetical protein
VKIIEFFIDIRSLKACHGEAKPSRTRTHEAKRKKEKNHSLLEISESKTALFIDRSVPDVASLC